MFDPLHQFEIHTLIPLSIKGLDVSFTNSSLFMLLAVLVTIFFLVGGIYRSSTIPNRWQSLVEMAYGFVGNLMDETIGIKGRP
ncbi:MAG: F0F1 ATP synthase subunit A, partial [Alphaproteobacteria bacterium]|nr:F0F1 ATP synthase subunit A [Alphaproteobacteria bacterium]